MTIFSNIKAFAANESGAVTVDWVVLTAAIVGLGLAVISSVRTGVGDLATDISTSLSGATVATLGELGVNQQQIPFPAPARGQADRIPRCGPLLFFPSQLSLCHATFLPQSSGRVGP